MKKERVRIGIVSGLFLLAAVWFFVPVGKPEGASVLFAMRLALPAAVLALAGIGLLPWSMTAGFFFCAVGDAMGVLGSFEGQMGGFALAHICFIICLAKSVKRSAIQEIDRRTKVLFLSLTALLGLLVLVFAFVFIIPRVDNTVIRIGCAVYALLLAGTMWTAWLRSVFPPLSRSLPAAWGATFFFVSDLMLAYNKFVAPIPNSGLLIMISYYAALLLLFFGTLKIRPLRNDNGLLMAYNRFFGTGKHYFKIKNRHSKAFQAEK